jgi:hypothetical protein
MIVRDIRLGRLTLGHFVHLEDGPVFRGPFILLFVPLPIRLRHLLGWWRPTAAGALSKGYREAFA